MPAGAGDAQFDSSGCGNTKGLRPQGVDAGRSSGRAARSQKCSPSTSRSREGRPGSLRRQARTPPTGSSESRNRPCARGTARWSVRHKAAMTKVSPGSAPKRVGPAALCKTTVTARPTTTTLVPGSRCIRRLRARLHQGTLSHQVIELAATGQHDMAATGQVRLAVVTPSHQGIPHDPNKCSPPVLRHG